MKSNKTYHYRIVATSPAGDCVGPDQTIMTGALPSGLPNITVDTRNAAELYGGFLIVGQFVQGGGGTGSPAFILDADGEFVWAYIMPMRDVTGVRPSYDGQYMWLNSANVPESQGANVRRVTMDGLMEQNFSTQFAGASHMMTVLPDETVAFFAYGSNGCDDIKEFNPTTQMVTTIINAATAHGAGTPCHVNAIEYSPEDDSLVFSDLDNDNITKVSRATKQVTWVLGGSTTDFTGTGSTWSRQHGIDVLDANTILFFNNGTSGGSTAIEMALDMGSMMASRAWTYTDADNLKNDIMGDVQRLENGNTIVAYSTKGVLQEVNAAGQVLEELVWGLPGAYGYIQKRKTLYGPPPR